MKKPLLFNFIALVFLTSTLFVSSCNLPNQNFKPIINSESFQLPEGEFARVAWFEDFIVIEATTDNGVSNLYSSRLWKINLDGSNFQKLDFPGYSACGTDGFNGFKYPQHLPDGRLGFLITCRTTKGAEVNHLVSMAYDLTTEKLEQFPKYDMPYFFFGVECKWNSQMNEGIAFADNLLRSWVYKLSLEKWEQIDLGFPQIRGIDWSPNDATIAFIAAPEQGLSGMSRADAKFSLYTMEPNGSNIKTILESIYDPYDLLWSKDGQYLIFNGEIKLIKGVWILNLGSRELQLINRGYVVFGGLSSNGDKLLGLRQINNTEKKEIVIFDLSEILK